MTESEPNNPYHPTTTKTRLDQVDISRMIGGLRTSQVVVFALAAGPLVFVAVALFAFMQSDKVLDFNLQPIVLVGWLVAVSAVPMSILLPSMIGKQMVAQAKSHQKDAAFEDLMSKAFSSQLIIGCVILEGAGLLNVVAFMLNCHPGSLVAAIVMAALTLLRFPTKLRLQDWLASQVQSD